MTKHVAKVAVFRGPRMLMGRRRDNGRWSCPGGHVEPGESATAAAHRELAEETGLETTGMLRPIDRKAVKNGDIVVHAFRGDVDGEPSAGADPAAEYAEFRWVDPESMPSDVMRNLHSEPDVVLDAIGASGSPWSRFGEEA